MSNHGTNRQKIKAMNNGVNVTYIQLTNSQSNTHHVYDDEDDNEDTQYLIENIENDEDQIESENVHTESESNAAETIEILETVTIDQKRSVPKTTITKKLIERKSKKDGKKIGRKRRHAEQTREIRKNLANTNKTYINAKGQEVRPKIFDDAFECACTRKCTEPYKLPLKTRRQIFNMFWNIGSYEGRCAFINSCVNEIPKKRCYTKKKEESRRKNTRKYFLKGVEVCKKAFTKTLMISNSRIDVCLVKMENENFTDERGRKRNFSGFPEEKKVRIVQYIKNNYDDDKTLRSLWQSFVSENPTDVVSESYFKRLFYSNFDLKVKRVHSSSRERNEQYEYTGETSKNETLDDFEDFDE